MKRWIIKGEYDPKQNIVEQLLKIRGIVEEEKVQEYLHPLSLTELFRQFPQDFKDSLKNAKEIVEQCISDSRTIVIHGDYDADGISSTAILYNAIKKELDYSDTHYFIPNRFDHGYGISTKSVDAIVGNYPDRKLLFITVDSGITAVEEVGYIKRLGHKVIITDHHHKPDVCPEADALVWNDNLVGASVAWIFSKVLGSKNPESIVLASLATVTDLQPVLGFNRSVVKKGLEILNTKPPAGISEILNLARKREGEITTYDLGWMIGPRLNASGRLVDASDAVRLFVEEDINEIKRIALKLHELNLDRQDKTLEMYALASDYPKDSLPKIIISDNEEYHEGIIGLVAARLVQKYYRPAVVISLNEEFGKGSVRSVGGINIIEVLHKFDHLFESVGGHPMAAGFTIKRELIPELKDSLTSYANSEFSDDLLVPELEIDLKLPISMIDLNLVADLDKMKPFGLGNEEPVFTCENVGLIDISYVGKEGQHVVLKFFSEGKYYKGIFFNGSEEKSLADLKVGDKVNIAFNVKENRFNGGIYLDLILKDVTR